MAEQVVPALAGVRWNPGVSDAVLIVTENGLAALGLNPHPDDASRDRVVLVWSGTWAVDMGAPNDEALSGHRLYERGLADLTWAGVVEHSERITDLERRNRVHPDHDPERFSQLRHFIVPLKEGTAEIIAENVQVQRHPGPPLDAASLALRSSPMQ
ncbi:MAG: hypothetical protein JO345_30410 [Streptosporangiaceae bacterium]|nr:hypothetical protein [Streptosporangiaceae bacterium]